MTGLSHRTAPLAKREAMSLTRDEYPAALDALQRTAGRGVILSTCNRTEVYTVARDAAQGRAALDRFLEAQFRVDSLGIRPHFYELEQDEAIEHLFRVAAGLDSLIIGESEILGQVRDAFGMASSHGAAAGVLAHLFHSALRAGKRARAETEIGRNALSVSRACVELSRRVLGDLAGCHGLIVGVGEASWLAARALRDSGVATITIANRTPEHAQELAGEVGARVADLGNLRELLAEADIVVSATGAPDFVVARSELEEAAALRRGAPLLLIDMASPRDIEPGAASVDGVELYTLDDLEAIAEANRREREAEAVHVERIVLEEAARFRHWWDARGVTPTISAMRRRAERVRAAEVARALAGAGGLSPEHAERVEAMSRALVKKLLHAPTQALRDRKDEAFTQSARELFSLDDA